MISKCVFCDGYNFLIVNKNTGEKYFIEGDENLVEFFQNHDTLYHLSYNSHPDCQCVKGLGIEDPGESALKNTNMKELNKPVV